MWVEETKNGKYKFVERYTDFMTGKQKRVSVVMDKNTAQTRKVAQRALDAKIDKAMKECMSDERPITLGELVEAYREDQKQTVKQSTYKQNYFTCESFTKLLGKDTLVERLSAQFIRQTLLASGKEPGTLNTYLSHLKSLLRWGYHNDLVQDIEYLDKIESFKDIPHKLKIQDKFLEAEELKKLISGIRNESWRLLTEFLALSGLRIGEAIALTREDVNLKERLIHVSKTYDTVNRIVTTTKTFASSRNVYMQDELMDVCQRINIHMLRQRIRYGYGESTLFFQGKDGGYIFYGSYNGYLGRIAKKTLGRSITPHALRHTHASLLMEGGIGIDTISRRLGHEDSKITREIYLHVTEKLIEKDNEQIALVKIM